MQPEQLSHESSSEKLRQLVRREGKTARNLVTWSVPTISRSMPMLGHGSMHGRSSTRARNKGDRSKSVSHAKPPRRSKNHSAASLHLRATHSEELCMAAAGQHSQTQRGQQPLTQQSNLHARYWSYLFDNLHRAVDEIYCTCEEDESVIECQEVVMTLDACRKDFEALIKRIVLQKAYENSDAKSRPLGLAWEVRKTTSPGKPRSQPPSEDSAAQRQSPRPSPARNLDFGGRKESGQSPGPTWADRVRGIHRVQPVACTKEQLKEIKRLEETCGKKEKPKEMTNSRLKEEGIEGEDTLEEEDRDRLEGEDTRGEEDRERMDDEGIRGGEDRERMDDEGIRGGEDRERMDDEGIRGGEDRERMEGEDTQGGEDRERMEGEDMREGEDRERMEGEDTQGGEDRERMEGEDIRGGEDRERMEGEDTQGGEDRERMEGEDIRGGEDVHVVREKGWEKVTRGRRGRASSSGKERTNSVLVSSCTRVKLPTCNLLRHKSTSSASKPVSETSECSSTVPAIQGSPLPEADCSMYPLESPASVAAQVPLGSANENSSQTETYIYDPANDISTAGDQEEHESTPPRTWSDIIAEYDAHESYRQSVSWADRCESPPDMLPEVPRSPGRAIQMHQKLSSPSRKRPIEESRRILEERQAKAQQQRDKLQEEKTQKSKIVTEKIREARETRDARTRQWREEMEGRLQRAELLRSSHLQEIVRKAQEEDAKVSEIAFINTLEAQNKKIQVLERHQVHEARMLDLQEERQRKREEQAAREEAAQERRRVLEAERVAKLLELDLRRREQDAKIEQMRLERDKAREEAAREKTRERERKLEARNTAIQLSAEELEKRLQIKRDESSRRYDQQLEQKKGKAAVSTRHLSSEDAPSINVYKKMKWCSICHVKIISEVYMLSHLRGQRHQEALVALEQQQEPSALIVEAPEEQQGSTRDSPELQERLRAGRKRAKKLRQRMASRVRELEAKSQAKPSVQIQSRPKLQKALRELGRQLEGSELSAQLDRTLGEISRSIKLAEDQRCICQLGGVASLLRLLLVHSEPNPSERKKTLPEKTFQLAVNILQSACAGNTDNCRYFVLSNKFGPVVDLVLQHLEVPEPGQTDDPVSTTHLCGPLLGVLATVLSALAPTAADPSIQQPITDCISYLACTSVLDRMCEYFNSVTGPTDSHGRTQLIMGGVNLLVAVTACMHHRVKDVFMEGIDDPSSLITVLQQTDLVGLLQLLYAILLHDGPPRHFSSPPTLPQYTLSIATAAMKALNNIAILNLRMVQACLGAEGVSLEFRHVVSYLLWYCSHYSSSELLQELILAVGYFCVLNTENQVFLQSGRNPTLLQLLCGLPFQYFSNPELTRLLFPTLVAACYQQKENRAILQQEISPRLLVAFLQENLQATQDSNDFTAFCHRFPQTKWRDALQFFSS